MTELIGVIAVAVVAWFAAGTFFNVRKGSALMRWMQGGLPVLGGRATVRWLGSTVVEMAIREASPPFASATVVVFLEARDLPWMWALGRARGRRDTFIVRGVLRRAPRAEFEALDPASWSGREALPRVPREWPLARPSAACALTLHGADAAALERGENLVSLAASTGTGVLRLSVRRTEPHFQLHLVLPDTRQRAQDLFATIRMLAERSTA